MFPSRGGIFHAIAIILNFVTYSEARQPSRIIEGTDATPGEFPWQASLRIYDKHICGAAIISKRHILTAAHCVDKIKAPYSEMTVVTGSHTLKPGTGHSYRVKNIAIHEKYVKRTPTIAVQNDIAVIGLLKEIKVDEFQKPISLPVKDVSDGEAATVTGFGRIGPTVADRSTILQKLNIVVQKSAGCFAKGARIQGNQFCGIEGAGHCIAKGDSGSPVFRNGSNIEMIGLVSTTAQCGLGIPSVYTKIYSYLDFIKRAVAST